ncbi:MAG: TM0996/MTH895 family glutaredoxin-like protein [Epsilonproteobacteria bacterium]|nr:TM0996/MTH895 family glutaredoxin-like protein [Campylobacterota bacterium]
MGTCDPASGCCATPAANENTNSACCATPTQTAPKQAANFSFTVKKGKIEVLGTGCKKCKDLELAAKEAVKELGSDHEVIKVEDIAEIAKYGVTSTPALVIDGVVKSTGRILSVEDIKKLLA